MASRVPGASHFVIVCSPLLSPVMRHEVVPRVDLLLEVLKRQVGPLGVAAQLKPLQKMMPTIASLASSCASFGSASLPWWSLASCCRDDHGIVHACGYHPQLSRDVSEDMFETTRPNRRTRQRTSQRTSQLEFPARSDHCTSHVQPDLMTSTGGMSSAFAPRAAMARLMEGSRCAIYRSSLSVLRGIP